MSRLGSGSLRRAAGVAAHVLLVSTPHDYPAAEGLSRTGVHAVGIAWLAPMQQELSSHGASRCPGTGHRAVRDLCRPVGTSRPAGNGEIAPADLSDIR